MKRIIFASLLVALAAVPALPQRRAADPKAALLKIERALWQAWENKDKAVFDKHMAPVSINVTAGGVDERDKMMSAIATGACEIRSWSIDDGSAKVYWIDKDAVIITYKAAQDATCGGQTVPANVWASSVYVKRGNAWLAVHHQETPAM
jgi:hypothetical protein